MKKTLTSKAFGITVAFVLILAVVLTTLLSGCSSAPATTSAAPAASQAAAKPITLVFTSHNSGDGFWRKSVIDPYFREIEKRTNNRIKIEEHWNGELVSLKDAYDAMLKGTVDLAEFFPSMLQGRFVMDDVVSFSTYYTNRPARVVYELGQAYPKMNEPYNDSHLLLKNLGYSAGMATTKKQITDLAGSKGIKLGPVGQWSSALMEAYGWVPTPVPPEESTTALQTGVQEGSGASMYLFWEFGWGPIMKYVTFPIRVDEMEVNLAMNKAKWNSLPKDIQDAIEGAHEWAIDLQDTAVVKNAHDSIPLAEKEFGIKFYTLPDTEVAKMVQLAGPVQAAYIKSLTDKGLPGKEFVDKYMELDKKYSDAQYYPK